ncbi:(deoxy)nucleoside triphosphate pyrophosphohydrolase [Nocardioides caeni]|uniref:(deoxy)nucleoside triphosphate pyrophosphohydrolase n=1 Tax=Nocardioides caeni TaxID=574700 RepID=UPI0013C30036|nr:(deoxy)nucleoside triphosphate pyrophosphohydrolase [Nocardioides caeni]
MEIPVVGAVVVRDGLVLCAQRGPDGSLPGKWEFPGGKVEPGESPRGALVREIDEELGCTVEVDEEIATSPYDDGRVVVVLTTFWCRLVGGVPRLTEHAELRWVAPGDLACLDWAPADVPAVEVVAAAFNSA